MCFFRGSDAAEMAVYCPMWWIGLFCVLGRASGGPLATEMWNDTSVVSVHNDTVNLTDRYQRSPPKIVSESRGADPAQQDPPFLYDWLPIQDDVDIKGASVEYVNSNQSETDLTKELTTRESSISSAARTMKRLVKPPDYIPSWAALGRDKSLTDSAGNSDEQETPKLPFLLINPYKETRAKDGDNFAGFREDNEPEEDKDSHKDSRSTGTVFIHSLAPASKKVDNLKKYPAMSGGMPEDSVHWDVSGNKRTSDTTLSPEHLACVMWLGPALTRKCCIGVWYGWPTCHCLGFLSCDEGDVH